MSGFGCSQVYGKLISDHVSLVGNLLLELQTGQPSGVVNDQSNLVMLTRLCSSICDDQFWLIKISFSDVRTYIYHNLGGRGDFLTHPQSSAYHSIYGEIEI